MSFRREIPRGPGKKEEVEMFVWVVFTRGSEEAVIEITISLKPNKSQRFPHSNISHPDRKTFLGLNKPAPSNKVDWIERFTSYPPENQSQRKVKKVEKNIISSSLKESSKKTTTSDVTRINSPFIEP